MSSSPDLRLLSISLETVRALLDDVFAPGRFFVRSDLPLVWQSPLLEEVSWEIFRGRLLDAAHTRQTASFYSWNIYHMDGAAQSAEPYLSVKLDEKTGQIHVVRAILSHVWEGFDAGDHTIQSRERTKWVRELVGTISLESCADLEDLPQELMALLGAAVQGTSKLPLNSVEAPVPAFSLGQLAYLGDSRQDVSRDQPLRTWQEMLEVEPLSLESLVRALPLDQAAAAARQLVAKVPAQSFPDFPRLLRQLFNYVSLSPYTQFVDATVAFVEGLVDVGAISSAAEVDFWGWLLRQLGRHLTAYDLITFHFRGANYPDALLLDAALKRYVELIERNPELFRGNDDGEEAKKSRLRRRALRQGCLLRRFYEGHPVPDAPTSPGENARVLPAPFVRVPEEQLLNSLRRRKGLYEGDPLPPLISPTARTILRVSFLDLAEPREWRELGTALFIDRPFGWGKAVGEPDLTPLLAHEAYSPSIARRRIHELGRLALDLNLENGEWESLGGNVDVLGLPAAQVAEPDRPVVSLADARRVADDFVVLRTLPKSLEEVFGVLDFAPLHAETSFRDLSEEFLLVRLRAEREETVLALFDSQMRRRLEMVTDLSGGFVIRRGREMPGAGFAGGADLGPQWDRKTGEY